ncbi:MAG: hypothetical protein HQM08_01465 [Candidatus Riflebacteria bacterium]|nr:hypothetical protein [Candidatus Riflebacteria bacterium]
MEVKKHDFLEPVVEGGEWVGFNCLRHSITVYQEFLSGEVKAGYRPTQQEHRKPLLENYTQNWGI